MYDEHLLIQWWGLRPWKGGSELFSALGMDLACSWKPVSSAGNAPWCQPCNNGMEHFLTLSHTCCQQEFASSLFKLHGGEETVRVLGIFGNAGPIAPGKAPQSPCSCLGSGVAPGNSCCVSTETRGLWESHKGFAQASLQNWVPGSWIWKAVCAWGFLQAHQQQEQGREKAGCRLCFVMELMLLLLAWFWSKMSSGKVIFSVYVDWIWVCNSVCNQRRIYPHI